LEFAESICAGESPNDRHAKPTHGPSSQAEFQPVAEIPAQEVLDLLSQLVDKSLIVTEEQSEENRYRYLETIRQYGIEKLRDSGEAGYARMRHLETMLILAETAEPELIGSSQKHWLNRLEVEHDNLRAALEWSRACERTDAILRFITALWRFWFVR